MIGLFSDKLTNYITKGVIVRLNKEREVSVLERTADECTKVSKMFVQESKALKEMAKQAKKEI